MKKSKFLTVMACLDEKSQNVLRKMQNELIRIGLVGTQTADVPFHISLGSFPAQDESRLKEKMEMAACKYERFSLDLIGFSDFSEKVLFLQPSDSDRLNELHNLFDGNYSDGLPYHAHVTVFCGDTQTIIAAKNILGELSCPLTVTVTSLLIGEFFPTKLLADYPLK